MSQNTSSPLPPAVLAKYIDHTLLRPDATEESLQELCEQAREYGFYSVCVYWNQIEKVVPRLEGSSVLAVAVVGFPEGDQATQQKVFETKTALAAGAREIDMVLNRPLFRADATKALEDVRAVVQAAAPYPVKLILETSELDDEEKKRACALAKKAGACFVKTSTGFSKSGATVEDVRLMREAVGSQIGVKASGGIRSYEKAVQMIQAGASRLGTSASVAIVQGAVERQEGY